jgi:hypothetical protein
MIGRDGVAGLVCLALAAGLFALTIGLPQPPLLPIGPAFYPRIVLGVMAALSVALVIEDVAARRRRGAAAPAATSDRGRVLLTFVLFALYVVAIPELGFRIATLLFVAALQAGLDPPRTVRDWTRVAAVAVATVFATYVMFEQYLYVLLPRGRLTDF